MKKALIFLFIGFTGGLAVLPLIAYKLYKCNPDLVVRPVKSFLNILINGSYPETERPHKPYNIYTNAGRYYGSH